MVSPLQPVAFTWAIIVTGASSKADWVAVILAIATSRAGGVRPITTGYTGGSFSIAARSASKSVATPSVKTTMPASGWP